MPGNFLRSRLYCVEGAGADRFGPFDHESKPQEARILQVVAVARPSGGDTLAVAVLGE
jgi:hypothetical protein